MLILISALTGGGLHASLAYQSLPLRAQTAAVSFPSFNNRLLLKHEILLITVYFIKLNLLSLIVFYY